MTIAKPTRCGSPLWLWLNSSSPFIVSLTLWYTHRSKAYRAQQQTANDIYEAFHARYGLSADGYMPDIAARVAAIHARLMDDKTGEYKKYLLDGGNILGLNESEKNGYSAFIEDDFSAADFDAYDFSAADYDAYER